MYERLGHTPGMLGVWGLCRDLCCDDGGDDVSLRLVEALPLFQWLGHTVLMVHGGLCCDCLQVVRGFFAGVGAVARTLGS